MRHSRKVKADAVWLLRMRPASFGQWIWTCGTPMSVLPVMHAPAIYPFYLIRGGQITEGSFRHDDNILESRGFSYHILTFFN